MGTENENISFIEEFNNSISPNQRIIDIRKNFEEKFGGEILNAWELFNQDVLEIPFLIEDLYPKSCLSGIIAPSESNKTNLTYGSAVAICIEKEYLGFMVNPEHRRVLIVPTEDISFHTAFRLRKQLEDKVEKGIYTKEEIERLNFAFGVYDVAGFVEEYLNNFKVDSVFIDAYSDINTTDTNSITETRKFLNHFHNLAVKHNTSIVIVHHSKKGSEHLTPSKNDAVGSVGFEGKMRHLVGLRMDKLNPRMVHLMILKSNCVEPEKKKYSLLLQLKDNLTLENTGEKVDINEVQHIKASKGLSKRERDRKVIELYDSGLSYEEIVDYFSEEGMKISISTICRIMKKKD